ncbi:MAG: cobalamin-dependent protein, partial [Pseudomonadota bacterium]|nr:cobalamin-dependent protein [Pseudomonadota bacterium]
MSQAAVTSERPLAPLPEPDYRIRFITAASLFDGHDASINVMRRILQSSGVEVIHLGHNRSVQEIVDAAVEEDAQGIAVSSYQGGHTEFFKYMIDMLTQRGRADIRVFGGGGGVIVPAEIQELQDYGVCRIYSPQDGHALGLQGMIDDMIERADFYPARQTIQDVGQLDGISVEDLARVITALENETAPASFVDELRTAASENKIAVPVLGITGTGGSGKSSLTDELILRLRFEFGDSLRIAILAIDPSRRKTGGALLGDRIRMNAIEGASVFMRSLATRTSGLELPSQLPEIIEATKRAGFGLVIVETPGIGQGDSGIVPLVDCSLYVMTPEFGAATQLEKIDMLDYADFIAINKFDRKGAEDALRDVRKQTQRNRQAFEQSLDQMPVYGTMASSFNDQGVTSLYNELFTVLEPLGLPARRPDREPVVSTGSNQRGIVPASRQRYLSEIAEAVRSYRDTAARQAQVARECQQLQAAIRMLGEQGKNTDELQQLAAEREKALSEGSQLQLQAFPKLIEEYSGSSL